MYTVPYIKGEYKEKNVWYTIHKCKNLKMETQLTSLAKKIIRARTSLKESQGDFGKRFGVKQRSTVKGWEAGAPPNAEHLTQINQFLNDLEETQGEVHAHQWFLPFDQPINFEFRVSPHSADSVRFAVQIKRKAS
jgi:transcriptional regulator with XRE-family HTH domain